MANSNHQAENIDEARLYLEEILEMQIISLPQIITKIENYFTQFQEDAYITDYIDRVKKEYRW